ncbi:hypothetical protein FDP25_15930 [Roseovarius sp. A21]|uniref:Uncharacterized protein n=1 Tax=Roseovarius bejariae TaxID=2576383 RepID=A0A844CQR7_9RHOB|nr:hypothetical protein [Roseovarius bejariae]MRU16932.1 hypothetical protein [Roseovarius bejariae]
MRILFGKWMSSLAALSGLWFAQAAASPLACEGIPVSVIADDPKLARRTCTSAQNVLKTLGACHVQLTNPVKITIVSDLPDTCLGLYHCGKNHIELLTPDAALDKRTADSVFSQLSKQDLFDSVLAHELTHAAYDSTPCPFGNCPATAEYLAYTMQIMSLPAKARQRVEAGIEINERITRDEVNPMILYMSPNTFIRKSWAHLTQREDRCNYVRQLMEGLIFLDTEHP